MFDVELVESSGRSLWAHSVVLAAACPMMKNAFMQTSQQVISTGPPNMLK